jgi:RNA polymerase sigma-70 factor (ECF subfamily)
LATDQDRRREEFEALVRPHLEWLYRLAYRYTGQVQDAEDLVQELLVRLYRNPGNLAQISTPRPWLIRALHNLFVDQWRHRRRTPFGHLHPEPWDDLFADQGGVATPEDELQSAGLRRTVLQALSRLDEVHRALLVLHDVEGHTLPELADALGLPLGTLKSRLFRARRKLRRQLGGGNPLEETDVIVVEG